MTTRGSTTARGYGYQHVIARERWATLVKAGRCACTRCGQPIHPHQAWHLDHTDDRTAYLGVAHAQCNRKAGGKMGAVRRWRTPFPTGRRTPRSRTRRCEICGTIYKANYRDQRTCSRTCGGELQRRNRPAKQVIKKRTGRRCLLCGGPPGTTKKIHICEPASERGRRAAELRANGLPWKDIVEQAGFTNPGAAYLCAKRYGDPNLVNSWP